MYATKAVNLHCQMYLKTQGKTNDILKNWLTANHFLHTHFIKNNYVNANYQTLIRDKNASTEVLITNYVPEKPKEMEVLRLF